MNGQVRNSRGSLMVPVCLCGSFIKFHIIIGTMYSIGKDLAGVTYFVSLENILLESTRVCIAYSSGMCVRPFQFRQNWLRITEDGPRGPL